MPTLSSLNLPPPRNWQDFEDLCCDLWRRLWTDPTAQKNGRGGQPQAGVDIFGRPNNDALWEGIQCKLKGEGASLTREEVETEVKKTRAFKPKLSKLLIATTAPRDASTQKAARQITAAQLKKKSFPVSIVFWEDMLLDLASFPELVTKHFPFTNIIVQKVGDGHEPTTGYAHLTLTRFLNARVSRKKTFLPNEAAALLSPYAAAVPLIGRENTLADLWTWMRNGRLVSIRVLTAPAGMGKTRLALDLCEAAVSAGWVAGFLREPELGRFRRLQNLSTWGWSRPTLIVVDYAASVASLLRDWLAELADHPGQADQPLRLLLLERHADLSEGWWRETFGSGSWQAEAVRALLDPPFGPYILPPIADPGQRRAVVASILERSGSPVRPPESGSSINFDRRLTEISWGGEPLFLLMAGLVAARAGFGEVLALSAPDLAFRIAGHETDRIASIARGRGIPESFLAHLAAYTTLCQGLSQAAADAVIEEEKESLRYCSAGDTPLVYQALVTALPGANGAIVPVLPDVVGEALILENLGVRSVENALTTVSRAAAKQGVRVTNTLIRIAQDFGGDPIAKSKVLGWLERVVAERGADLDSMASFLDQFPLNTLALREQAAIFSERAVELARNTGTKHTLALLLNNMAYRLNELDRSEEALMAIEESVAIIRDLAAPEPDIYRPLLAINLNNLATYLMAVGRSEEALTAGEEALSILQDFSPQPHGLFFLGDALGRRSAHLSALGRTEEALEVSERRVELFRNLTASGAPISRHGLAISLISLSLMLTDLDRREEALTAAEEATALYRNLAASYPDAFRVKLGLALQKLSLLLCSMERRKDALAAGRESVEVYQTLVALDPANFRPNLADALCNVANLVTETGHQGEALDAVNEAIKLIRELARTKPVRSTLAAALTNLIILLIDLGRRDEALGPAKEAVELYRDLAGLEPDTFRDKMANMLNNLSVLLNEAGRKKEALEASKEAVDLYRDLAALNPANFQPVLANSLDNLSCNLSDTGQEKEALGAIKEAVALYQLLAGFDPDAFRPDLALSLSNLSECLRAVGQRAEAMTAIEDAVRNLSPDFLASPVSFQDLMKDMVKDYLETTAWAGCEPDQTLLGPIQSALAAFG